MQLNIFTIILASGLVTGVYYFQFYDDGQGIREETKRLNQEINTVQMNIEKKKKKIEDAVNFDDSVKRLGHQLEFFYKYIPSGLTNRHMFEIMTSMLKKSGMNNLSMQGLGSQKKTEIYDVLTIKISAEGKFSQFLTFLSLLTDLDQIVVVGNVTIRPVSNTGSQTSGNIMTSFDVLGFRYNAPTALQDKESEKNKQT